MKKEVKSIYIILLYKGFHNQAIMKKYLAQIELGKLIRE